jgi:hypothetical protein
MQVVPGISFRGMDNLGPAGEFLRVSEHYRRMTDEELLAIAREDADLTPDAQQALANELSQRQLKIPPEEPPPPRYPVPVADPDNPRSYDEDRQLVTICTVWSLSDAAQVQTLLDRAGIPFFMGKEMATGVDAVTSNFADGVNVGIMNIGLPWARQAMQNYEPKDDPTPKESPETDATPVRCPKCHSEEIIFEEMVETGAVSQSAPKYKWTCDSCGHEWEDDGVVEA